MPESTVARFREQQALQEEAARQALYGPAITASHAFITARMERASDRLLRLFQEGKHEEAITLMESPTWGLEEDSRHITTTP
jgi:hypothetical protein